MVVADEGSACRGGTDGNGMRCCAYLIYIYIYLSIAAFRGRKAYKSGKRPANGPLLRVEETEPGVLE